MLQAVKMSHVKEIYIGTYFVPFEGQPGVEGVLGMVNELVNQPIRDGWQPWQMGTPYPGKYSFILNGVPTGALDGQWYTILWALPSSDL